MSGLRLLYISYDGMLEPLGQSQVLSYLKRLASTNVIHLVSFEKPGDWTDSGRGEQLRAQLAAAGIAWHPLTYHKKPSALATAWDIACGTALGLWLLVRHRLNAIHARSYVPSVMALALKRLTGARYIFDMRGFWADERVDGGIWPPHSRTYRVAKWFERRFLLEADHVVSLTRAAVEEMRRFPYLRDHMPPFTVIPTCADLSLFAPPSAPRPAGAFVLGYVGSAGTWYLFDEAVRCFVELMRARPGARFLVVNRGEHAFIRARLAAAGVPEDAFELTSSSHAEVPLQIARMDAGVFFIRPAFSKQASAPTKLGEFLGCGVPCIGNTGVGDMAGVLQDEGVGVALDGFNTPSLREGLRKLLDLVADPGTRPRCVAAARKHFSLDEGVRKYERVYDQLSPRRA